MNDDAADLTFPDCCLHCPYLHPVTESCDRDSPALAEQLSAGEPCPAYREAKSSAMRGLAKSIERP